MLWGGWFKYEFLFCSLKDIALQVLDIMCGKKTEKSPEVAPTGGQNPSIAQDNSITWHSASNTN